MINDIEKEKNTQNKIKSGFVAILGRPNVGKSTLMNHLIGMKIAAVSKRAQTTRKRIQTVYTDERGQIIFLDTPGINKAETKLGEYMLDEATDTLKTADLIMWIIEPSSFIGAGERSIVDMISKVSGVPVILVINKCDTCEQSKLSQTYKLYNDYMNEVAGKSFDNSANVSATEGTGQKELMNILYDMLPEGPMYFDEDTVTDETEREIAAEFIREKCLRNLDKEIPHGIAVIIDKMRTRPDGSLVDIEATIICERESHKGIIIGKNGAMLKKIGTQSRHDIEDMLQQRVNLKLWVKVRPGWRDKKLYMEEYGYKK
ncbi:MAG: GTPase Era [Eubacterium sp.]|nr:GTPase Era [Eubacterium sp.]